MMLWVNPINDSEKVKEYEVLDIHLVRVSVYEDGRLAQRGLMIKDDGSKWRYHGRWREWDDRGEIRFEIVFDRGKRQSIIHHRKDGKTVKILLDN